MIDTKGVFIRSGTNDVELRGDALSEIWWQGRQWAVTSFGIEARNGQYYIESDRLGEHGPEGLPNWPLHVCSKTWVDADDFCTAFIVGLVLHGQPDAFAPKQIREATALAIAKKRDNDRFAAWRRQKYGTKPDGYSMAEITAIRDEYDDLVSSGDMPTTIENARREEPDDEDY
jgi:hypothetical protein